MPMTLTLPNTSNLMFWKKKSAKITNCDPTFKVLYLGNILTPWAKGDGCEEKPLQTLWKTYSANPSKIHIPMELTVCNSGMKATTKKHGLSEYWAYRVTYCCASKTHPGVFCWVYRHEGPKMKQELRCHAALCAKPEHAKVLVTQLTDRLALALQEFRREKLTRQKARLSLANSCYDCPTMPSRKILLSRGTVNFRPPVEMSKIAPKLTDIEEDLEREQEEEKFFDWLRKVQESFDPCLGFEYSSSLDSDILSGCSSSASSYEEGSPARFHTLGSLNSLGEESSMSSSEADYFDDSGEGSDPLILLG